MSEAVRSDEDLGHHVLTISGSFRSVKAAAWTLAGVFIAIFVLNGLSDGEWSELMDRAPVLFLIWLGGILFLRWLVHVMRISIYTGGLKGRSYWSFRRRIRWDDIAGFRYDNSNGVANIVIEDRSGKEIWVLTEIVEREEFQQAVAPYFDWRTFLHGDVP